MLKTCIKCGVEKSTSDFYAHPRNSDGLLGRCKGCHRTLVRENRRTKSAYYRAYDRERFHELARRMAMKQKCLDARRRHPEHSAARCHVYRAVRDGRLTKPDACDRCGVSGLIHGHHDDHSKPLDVVWLCPPCHAARHLELGRLGKAAPRRTSRKSA